MRTFAIGLLMGVVIGVPAAAQSLAERFAEGQRLADAGQWLAVLEHVLTLPPLATSDEDRLRIANGCEQIGDHLAGTGSFERALAAAEAGLALRHQLHGDSDHVDVAAGLRLLGRCLFGLGRIAEALPRFVAALAMDERLARVGDEATLANTADWVATCLERLGRHGEALPHRQRALAVRQQLAGGADHAHVALGLGNLACCLQRLGRLDEALSHFEASVTMRQRLGAGDDDPEVATGRNNLATCLQDLGRLAAARDHFEWVLAAQRRRCGGADDRLLASSLNNLAACLSAMGRPGEALPRFEAALAMDQRLSRGAGGADVALDRANVAFCLTALGRPDEALTHLEEALAIWRRLLGEADHPNVAIARNNAAACLQYLGRLDEALRHYEASLAMHERLAGGGDHPDVALSMRNVGVALRALERHDESRVRFEQSLAMARRLYGAADHPLVVHCLVSLGTCLTRLGSADAALPLLEEARAMAARLHGDVDHRDVALVADARATCLARLGRGQEALAECRLAVGMLERLRDDAKLSAMLRQSWFDELKRGGPFERLQGMCVDAGRIDEAVQACERSRGRGLQDLLALQFDPVVEAEQRARQRGDDAGADRLRQLVAALDETGATGERLRHDLIRLPAEAAPAAREALRKDLLARASEVAARRRQLLDERARLLADVLPVGTVRTVAEIQAALRSGELLLQYTVTAEGSWLHVLAREGEPLAFVLPDAHATVVRQLPAWLRRISRNQAGARGRDPRGAVAPEAGAGSPDPAGELSASLIPALLWPRILAAKRVFVAPHRQLHGLPFELLVPPRPGGGDTPWLECGPPIAYVPSGTALHWLRRRARAAADDATSLDLLAVADPEPVGQQPGATGDGVAIAAADGGAGAEGTATPRHRAGELERLLALPRLRGARAEALAIAGEFARHGARTRILTGDAAVEPDVFDLAGTAKYLHFACHGIAEEYAGQSLSLLVLAQPRSPRPADDGLLDLDDLLQRWRGRLSSCRLVVLSACRTNVGPTLRDEAPQAVPLGFLFAGAPTVVSSLWAVDDDSTRELMTDFYRRLLAGERDVAAALAAARRTVRSKYADPFHWAPFVLFGCPD